MMAPAMPAHGAAGIAGALPFRQVAASITVVTITNRTVGKTARNVIEHGDAIGELGRVVIGQQEAAGTQADVLGLHQTLRHEEIG